MHGAAARVARGWSGLLALRRSSEEVLERLLGTGAHGKRRRSSVLIGEDDTVAVEVKI